MVWSGLTPGGVSTCGGAAGVCAWDRGVRTSPVPLPLGGEGPGGLLLLSPASLELPSRTSPTSVGKASKQPPTQLLPRPGEYMGLGPGSPCCSSELMRRCRPGQQVRFSTRSGRRRTHQASSPAAPEEAVIRATPGRCHGGRFSVVQRGAERWG